MSATIQSIEAILVEIPTIRPHKLSMTTMGVQTMVIVRVKDSDGLKASARQPLSWPGLQPGKPRKRELPLIPISNRN